MLYQTNYKSEVMKVNKGVVGWRWGEEGGMMQVQVWKFDLRGQIRINYLQHLLLSTAVQQMC